MNRATVLALLSIVVPSFVLAGPNAGGVLFLHANPSITYTTDTTDYCGQADLAVCPEAVTRVPWDPETVTVFYVLAAFPTGIEPRLKGASWRVQGDESKLILLDRRSCGDCDVADADWPESGSGIGQSWTETQTDAICELYWFASHAYVQGSGPDATEFVLIPHPRHGGVFVDDAMPPAEDIIDDYGRLGFGMDGELVCPAALPSAPEQEPSYEILLPWYDLFSYDSQAVREGKADAAEAVRNVYGGAWRVYSWNPQTETPQILYGTGAELAESFEDSTEAVAAAYDVLASLQSVLHADSSHLRLEATPEGLGRIVVHFQQTHDGLEPYRLSRRLHLLRG